MKRLFLLIVMCAWARAGVDRPVLGFVMDARGALHAVEGIAGAFVVGAVAAEAEAYVPNVAYSLEHRDAGFYVVDGDGGVVEILPAEAQCAVLMARGTVYATADEVVIGDVRLAVRSVRALRAVSAEFVQVSTDDGDSLLRVERGREAVFVLPAIPVQVSLEAQQ